ncbi:hypothetical protein CFK39_01530 [Brachybacterium avium]|uniref:Uncharacterized protein n=1 Tax=Brachybacterium avium TaxID=2017485 RepID=A0A220U9E0_9MICO|nr:hypothetical protein [Brachybacterium avium]ASK64738.1 hypothetical protein CFK39_01530 [Brachybacterium avium]
MIDQLMILAESGAHASEGLSAPAVGIGIFVILLTLLGFTWLTGGAHHRSLDKKRKSTRDSDR